MGIKKTYLILAFCVVSAIALMYGLNPGWFARTLLGVPDLGTDFSNILRAVTGLYLALGCFWLYAAFRPDYRTVAILTTAVFVGGLVVGRLLSITLDGWPSPVLVLAAVVELGLVPVALWVLRCPD